MNFWGETVADRLLLVIATLLVIALYPIIWGPQNPATHLLLQAKGGDSIKVSLKEDQLLSIDGKLGKTTVQVKDGHARIADSPCSGKVCLHYGWLEYSGETIACLPNGVVLSLTGGESRYDAINF